MLSERQGKMQERKRNGGQQQKKVAMNLGVNERGQSVPETANHEGL